MYHHTSPYTTHQEIFIAENVYLQYKIYSLLLQQNLSGLENFTICIYMYKIKQI